MRFLDEPIRSGLEDVFLPLSALVSALREGPVGAHA